jgi:4-amino-4-deoxy-L-arabinose transferase-like glycosyltransferase
MVKIRSEQPGWVDWALPLVVALLALIARAMLASADRVVWGDEPFYLWNARNLVTGRGYSFFNGAPDVYLTPLYPLVIAGLYLVLQNLELASRLCYVALGAALVFPIYGIARDLYGRRPAIIAALLLAAYPALNAAQLNWGTMTEPLYFLVAYAGLYATLRAWRDETWQAHVAAGALFGMAYLTRGEGIAYIVAVGGALAFIRLCERRLFSRDVLLRLLAMAGAFLLVALPYWIYLRVQTGQWMISGQAGMTYITCISLAYGDVAGFDRATWGLDAAGREVNFFSPDIVSFSMFDHMRADPAAFARLVYQNVRDFINTLFNIRMFPVFLLPFLSLGLFDFAWDRRRTKKELLLLASSAPALSFLLFFVQERYIGVALPLLVIWTAHGLDRFGVWMTDTLTRLRGRRGEALWGHVLTAIPVALLLVFCVAMWEREAAGTSLGSYRMAHREAGLWLAERIEPGATVMSRYPAIAFHAGADWAPTPNATIGEVLDYARSHGADYFVLDERETISLRPQLASLIQGELPAGLERMTVMHGEGEELVIFRVAAQ